MANYNKVVMVGRLTRDPETKTFASGGKVAKFGFAANDRKKDKNSGQWVDDPMFIDVEVYNSGEKGKTADFIEKHAKKGSNILIEGKLVLDVWEDKNSGERRSKHKIVAFAVQLLDKKEGGKDAGLYDDQKKGSDTDDAPVGGDGGDEIPF